jgi:hypothetical protein
MRMLKKMMMGKNLLMEYLEKIQMCDDKGHLFSVIGYHIAPTLSKLKPASIITLNQNNREQNKLWEKYKDKFQKEFKIEYIELKKTSDSICVMFFNRECLMKIINNKKNMKFLEGYGYSTKMSLNDCLVHLKKSFEFFFPHEIGVFLGFPLSDVKAFIKHPNEKYRISGYWKVYSNVKSSKKIFDDYDAAKINLINSVLNN